MDFVNSSRPLPTAHSLQFMPSPVEDYRKYIFLGWLLILGFTGLVGNSLLIHLTRVDRIYRGPEGNMHNEQERRALMYYFVFSLAVSGLLTTLLDIPIVILQDFADLLYSDWVCRVIRINEILFPAATFNILFIASVERYITIVHPFCSLPPSTARKLVKLAWVVAFVVSTIAASGYSVHEFRTNTTHFTRQCKSDNSSMGRRVIVVSSLTIVYFLPSIIVLFTSIEVMKVIWRKLDNPKLSLEWATKVRATRLLVALATTFMLPYLALLSYKILQVFAPGYENIESDYVIYHSFVNIAYSSVTLNPVVCFGQIRSLRKKLLMLLTTRNSQILPGQMHRQLHLRHTITS